MFKLMDNPDGQRSLSRNKLLDGCGFGLLKFGFEDIKTDFEQAIEKVFEGIK